MYCLNIYGYCILKTTYLFSDPIHQRLSYALSMVFFEPHKDKYAILSSLEEIYDYVDISGKRFIR